MKKKHPRDDYKELIELSLTYLGRPPANFKLRKPGAVHTARWMGKLIYSIKIVLLMNQIDENASINIFRRGNKQQKSLVGFVDFLVSCYMSWWINAASVASAPQNDIDFFNNVVKFGSLDKNIITAPLKSLNNHTWYLTEQNVVLSFF